MFIITFFKTLVIYLETFFYQNDHSLIFAVLQIYPIIASNLHRTNKSSQGPVIQKKQSQHQTLLMIRLNALKG